MSVQHLARTFVILVALACFAVVWLTAFAASASRLSVVLSPVDSIETFNLIWKYAVMMSLQVRIDSLRETLR